MRLIHRVSPPRQETESFRQLVFHNLTRGLKYLLHSLPDMGLALPDPYTPPVEGEAERDGWEEAASIQADVDLIDTTEDLRDGRRFPIRYLGPRGT
ncbi:hypothetical protein DFH09DRAFT_1121404 [Mycena vulgaris]|nr:hypothetical protein DFH09DRAFT_1121404 [Mycena vulgaris]